MQNTKKEEKKQQQRQQKRVVVAAPSSKEKEDVPSKRAKDNERRVMMMHALSHSLSLLAKKDGSFRLMLSNEWVEAYGEGKIGALLDLYRRFKEEGVSEETSRDIRLPGKDKIIRGWWATEDRRQCFYDGIKCFVVMVNTEAMDMPQKKNNKTMVHLEPGTPLAFVLLYDAMPRHFDEWKDQTKEAKALQEETWHAIASSGRERLREPFALMHAHAHRDEVQRQDVTDLIHAQHGEGGGIKDWWEWLMEYEGYLERELAIRRGFDPIKLMPDRAELVCASYLAHLAADSRFSVGGRFMRLLRAALPNRYIFLELEIKADGTQERLRAFYLRNGFGNVAELMAHEPARLFSRHAFMGGWLALHFGPLPENLIDSDPEEYMGKRFMLLNTLENPAYHARPDDRPMTLRDQYTRASRMDDFYFRHASPALAAKVGLFCQAPRRV